MQCHWKGSSYVKQPMDDFRKVKWVLNCSGWPGTTMSGEIGYPPKPRTFGSPEHDPAENKPLDRGPRRAARLVSPRSLPMRLLLQSAQFLLRQMSRRFLFVILDPLFDVSVRRWRKLPRSRVLPKKNSENLNTFFVWFSGLRTSGRKEAWRKARQRYAQQEEIIDVSGCRWGSLDLEFYRYSSEFH